MLISYYIDLFAVIADIILNNLDFDISNYKMKMKHIEYPDKQEDNINIISSKQDNLILLNQVKSLKQNVNTLQFERDQLQRKYKEKLEDNEVSYFFNCT